MFIAQPWGFGAGSKRIRFDTPNANLIVNSNAPTSLTAIAGPAEPFIIPGGMLAADGDSALLELFGNVGNTSGSAQSMVLAVYLGLTGTTLVYTPGSGAFTFGNASAPRALDIAVLVMRISATLARMSMIYGVGNTGTVASTDSGTAIGSEGAGSVARVAAANITIDPTKDITMKVVGTMSAADNSVFCYIGARKLRII